MKIKYEDIANKAGEIDRKVSDYIDKLRNSGVDINQFLTNINCNFIIIKEKGEEVLNRRDYFQEYQELLKIAAESFIYYSDYPKVDPFPVAGYLFHRTFEGENKKEKITLNDYIKYKLMIG